MFVNANSCCHVHSHATHSLRPLIAAHSHMRQRRSPVTASLQNQEEVEHSSLISGVFLHLVVFICDP